MLLGFEHVGITVSDLDRSLQFYCDLIGMKLILRKTMPRGSGELAFVDMGNGQLELVCPAPPVATPAAALEPTRAGIRHLPLAFTDIDATYAELIAAGVPSIEPPRDAHNREILARVAFLADPDGNVIELAQRQSQR